jgi:hypothetical protein
MSLFEIVSSYITTFDGAVKPNSTESFPAANDDEDGSGKDIAVGLFGLSLVAIGQTTFAAYASPLSAVTGEEKEDSLTNPRHV